MDIKEISVDQLIPYEFNNKIHDATQVNRIANSIKEFWFLQPIVIDKNNIVVVWHGRLEWAKKLWLKTVPCLMAENLTDEQIKKYRILDNKLNESERDIENLKLELEELPDLNFGDLHLDVSDLFPSLNTDQPIQEVTEDEIPSLDKEAKAVEYGDLFQIGRHRLMCGSSTNVEDVAELMWDVKAKMLFTSPPYSDMREYNWWKDLSVSNIAKFISIYRLYTDYQCVNLWIQRKENEIVQYWDEYINIAKESWYKLIAWNIRDKLNVGSIWQQSAFFPIRHEWIFVFWTEYFETNKIWEKKEENIWRERTTTRRQADWSMKVSSANYSDSKYKQMESVLQMLPELWKIRSEHPATFPIWLPAEYIKAMSNVWDSIIEPFWWSWTTMIACEQLDRKCYMMELDPKYVEVIIKRFHNQNPNAEIKCMNREISLNKILSDEE